MKKDEKSEPKILRQKAEDQLKRKFLKTSSPLSEAEMLKLIHELAVHQIELELQNDELQSAKAVADIATSKYTDLYDFAPSGYFTLSKLGDIIELNLTSAKILDKERSKLINSRFSLFVSSDTRLVFNLFLDKVFESKCKETCEIILVKDDNMPTNVLLTGTVSKNQEQCNVTMVDITERKQAEEKQAILAYKFNERVKELDCLYSISSIIEIPKISSDEIMKQIVNVMSAGWQYPDITCARITIDKYDYRSNNYEETKWKLVSDILKNRKKCGCIEVSYLEERAELDEGPFLKQERSLIDSIAQRLGRIAERKWVEEALSASEELYRTLTESSPEMIFLSDKSGLIKYANTIVANMFNLNPKELIGKHLQELFPLEIGNAHYNTIIEIFDTKQPFYAEFEEVFPTGKIWLEAQLSPVFNHDGSVMAVLGILNNITNRKLAEEEIRKSKEQLRALTSRLEIIREEEKAFISREIHDQLGHLLTVLKIDLITFSKKPIISNLNDNNEIDTMIDIINQLIDSTRKLSTKLRPGVLDQIGLSEAIEWLTKQFCGKGKIKFKLKLPNENYPLNFSQKTAVFRICQEAITNIVRHSEASQVIINFTTKKSTLLLEIIDNGKGVTLEQINNPLSLGILGMKERAYSIGAKLTLKGNKNGTKISLALAVE